ncbi:hypothetical protein CSB08_00040 [Candidatus Gracilibacteria bacterium]|nr:MAG: hypothetical protein CSB08_00040 [Candidatus Gracilibacteria bacterium]PIE85703.1 MAG: hypothetical protein CSA08_00700 [Candidatus Gracilibacteria bacterium]
MKILLVFFCSFVSANVSASPVKLDFVGGNGLELIVEFDLELLSSDSSSDYFGAPKILGGMDLNKYTFNHSITFYDHWGGLLFEESYGTPVKIINSKIVGTQDLSLDYTLPVEEFLNSSIGAVWWFLEEDTSIGLYDLQQVSFTSWEYITPSPVLTPAPLALLGIAGAALLLRKKQKLK